MTKINIENDEKENRMESEDVGCEERSEGDGGGEASAEDNTDSQQDEDVGEDDKTESAEDANTQYLRLMADFQNYKKRVEKEKRDLYSYANEKLVTDQLEVLDNFERALDHDTEDEGFKQGMEMIYKQLGNVLERAGLTEIEALGKEFDPNVHNAVMKEENDEYESGMVSAVLQKGYTLNGKVIRPAMVKVVG